MADAFWMAVMNRCRLGHEKAPAKVGCVPKGLGI